MTPDDVRHGTQAGAMAHWRADEQPCRPCRQATNRLDKAARIDRDRGNPRIRPLGRHAWRILDAGTPTQLANATGITAQKITMYHTAGPETRVNRKTQDRILAAAGAPLYTPAGIQRRLQALAYLGWPTDYLAERCGLYGDGLKRLRIRDVKFVRDGVARAVIATYADHHMRLPDNPSTYAQNMARRRGWLPPLAWDDIDFDTAPRSSRDTGPAGIDHAVVSRVLAGETLPTNTPERHEIMRRWLADGNSERSLCVRLGWHDGRYGREQESA